MHDAADILAIKFPAGAEGQIDISITDASGKIMHDYSIAQTPLVNLNIAGLSPGVYYARVMQNGRAASSAFVKM